MALIDDSTPLRPARDGFETYYAEKIWDWIPEIYKHEDGLAQNPGVLRAMIEVLARQAAVARRSIDRLWEDEFIDFCDDWTVPYLGDLVGTRLVNELNRRGRRTDVANTLFYRRRKGTPLVMERLIADITGWAGVVVEGFRRLGRTRHGLDPSPDSPTPLSGPVTGTPPGGIADLRRSRGGDLVDGPFDEYFHTPDFRRHRGFKGRVNIPKLNFHLYRLRPFRVILATPRDFGERRFTFDPSGRDVPLFRPDQRPEPDRWTPSREWQIPAPIPCRLLGAASYLLQPADVPAALETELAPWVGQLFEDEARFRATLATVLAAATLDAAFAGLLEAAVTPTSPKIQLLPEAVAVTVAEDSGGDALPHQLTVSANLSQWIFPAADKELGVDPERGRFQLRQDPGADELVFVPVYHYGFSGEIGAGTYERRGSVATENVTEIPGGAQNPDGEELDPGPIAGFALPADGIHEFVNSKTYRPDGDGVADVDQLCLQARDGERPYLELTPDGGGEWTFTALDKPPGEDPDAEENLRWLTLEGLWIGIVPDDLAAQNLAQAEDRCDPVPVTLVLDGHFDRVVIRHSTLDPGGEQARLDPLQCTPIPSLILEVRGQVEELVIESSIVGAIRESTSAADPCSVGKLILRDSIVHSLVPGVDAIFTRVAEAHLERVTVFGDVTVDTLYATETLIQGTVKVTDNQHGCFRFSAADDAPDQRLPPRFESHLFAPRVANHFFVSRRFGDPGYAQLSETAPAEIVRGAENGSEIGAWSHLLNPIKLDDLRAKIDEFMPFGLIAQTIFET
ncbi:MAG: hypothetical protein V3T72_03930 [Thermoanaerobaculia bacterium]